MGPKKFCLGIKGQLVQNQDTESQWNALRESNKISAMCVSLQRDTWRMYQSGLTDPGQMVVTVDLH